MTVPNDVREQTAVAPSTEAPWFDEAVVVDADWAVIYTLREDGSRRGIRVPLRPILEPDPADG